MCVCLSVCGWRPCPVLPCTAAHESLASDTLYCLSSFISWLTGTGTVHLLVRYQYDILTIIQGVVWKKSFNIEQHTRTIPIHIAYINGLTPTINFRQAITKITMEITPQPCRMNTYSPTAIYNDKITRGCY